MGEVFTLEWRRAGELRWLAWEGGGAHAAFATREGGVSAAPYDSLDLGYTVGDDPECVTRNRRRLCDALGLRLERLVVGAQVHGTELREVGDTEAGRGALGAETALPGTDMLLTATSDLPIAVSHADCVPVVIVARGQDGRPALAAVHAGWRGMLAGAVGQAAAALARRGRLLGAVVGPSIGPSCFTADAGLRARFEARFPGSASARTVDLWVCACRDLEAAGVPPAGITVTGICTTSDERFFSHRREGGLTGRHLGIAWSAEEE